MNARGVASGSSFTVPNRLTGNVLSLYGDLGITLNGADVSAWADQGPKKNNATQGTPADQPVYVPGDTDFNGHGSVSFDAGNTESMDVAGVGAALSGTDVPFHIFMVLKKANTANSSVFAVANDTDSNPFLRLFSADADDSWQLQHKQDSGSSKTLSGGASSMDTNAALVEMHSSNGTTGRLIVDGSETSGDIDLGLRTTDNCTLGNIIVGGTPTSYASVKFAHVEIFTQLSATNEAAVRDWLKKRYGTP